MDDCDKLLFELDEEQMAAFMAVLDDPPRPNDALIDLMGRTPPWRE